MAWHAAYTERECCAVYSLLHSTSLYFIAGCSPFGKHHHETVWWINYHLKLASEKLRSQDSFNGIMLKESSEEKQNNSAEKISLNGSLWAEWCPAPRCCAKRKKTEGTVSLPLQSGAAGVGRRHTSRIYTLGCKEQGSWELTVLAENPRKQHSKSREKMLPWVHVSCVSGRAFNIRGGLSRASHSQCSCRQGVHLPHSIFKGFAGHMPCTGNCQEL